VNPINELSKDERVVLATFADCLSRTRQAIMPINQILQSRAQSDRALMMQAIENLVRRGWLVANSPLQWHNNTEFVLLGEGLKMAQAMAEAKPQHDGGPQNP
jgi:hypothetical protein